jgi:hypothetical protein
MENGTPSAWSSEEWLDTAQYSTAGMRDNNEDKYVPGKESTVGNLEVLKSRVHFN